MNTINIPTFLNIDLVFSSESAGRRYGAYFIDWAVKLGYLFIMTTALSLNIDKINTFFGFLMFMPLFFYTFLLEWLNKGQTIGKKAVGIRVINSSGGEPSVGQCAIRWMFLFADAYGLFLMIFISPIFAGFAFFGPVVGALLIGISKKNQRLGDIAAQTYVVSVKEDHYSIDDTIYAYATNRNTYTAKYPEVLKLSDKDMTIIQTLLEKAEDQIDYELAGKLAIHVKKILKIESAEDNYVFLKTLLKDYNHLSINQ
jgi:uncharacterized RDD family membrane protein YckC